MKKLITSLLTLVLVFSICSAVGGCYVVSSQKMKVVKGTYKLTHYTYTPKYERREGYTPTTKDYINDEEYLYEDYLVVTGEGKGYYVHKQAGGEVYSKEVTLSYEYDTDDSSRVAYVIFNDAITLNSTSGFNKMGVTKNGLNYTLNAIDYTELFTKRPMRSEALSVRWQKVSSDTDLSYAEEQVGKLKKYDYNAFGVRGIYQLNSVLNVETGEYLEDEYKYFYYVIDTAENAYTATAFYALLETPDVPVTKQVSITRGADDWSSITIDGKVWTLDSMIMRQYNNEADGLKRTLSRISNDITFETVQSFIPQIL